MNSSPCWATWSPALISYVCTCGEAFKSISVPCVWPTSQSLVFTTICRTLLRLILTTLVFHWIHFRLKCVHCHRVDLRKFPYICLWQQCEAAYLPIIDNLYTVCCWLISWWKFIQTKLGTHFITGSLCRGQDQPLGLFISLCLPQASDIFLPLVSTCTAHVGFI